MEDLIRRHDTIDALGDDPIMAKTSNYDYVLGRSAQYRFDRDAINRVASASPEIVRCSQCKFFHASFCEKWSRYGTIMTKLDDFCSRAERREE